MAELERDLPSALQDFWRARRRANMREALSFLRKEPALLSYEEVRRKLRGVEASAEVRLEEVPLDAIVGSVGRYNDFTRGFLPRQDSDRERWARVLSAMTGMAGVPPIEVYRLGDAYFVKDGNHRVSVARQLGSRYIQAYVTPVHSKVNITPDLDADELIIKAEQTNFLLDTRLDELRPEADVSVTVPGSYGKLAEHISVHRYYMGLERDREIPYGEAVAHWYDTVYLPVVESIRKHGLLRGFPGRTEADLYLWLAEHRAALEGELGWSLPAAAVAESVAEEVGGEVEPAEERRERALRVALGEEPGFERICEDVLVALPGLERGVVALEQALIVARREGSRLYGLHVTETRREGSGTSERRQGERDGQDRREQDRGHRERRVAAGDVELLRATFEERCRSANVAAQFALATGQAHERLLERSTWSDLVVAPLTADGDGAAVLSGGFRAFLRRSPRPVLTINGSAVALERALLAYDGGTRANAALFVAAYIAAKWGAPLTVLTVNELGQGSVPLERARDYLDAHGIEAVFISGRGRVGETIVETAREEGCDTILMGSYKYSRWIESMLGGVLEEVLRQFRGAVLVT